MKRNTRKNKTQELSPETSQSPNPQNDSEKKIDWNEFFQQNQFDQKKSRSKSQAKQQVKQEFDVQIEVQEEEDLNDQSSQNDPDDKNDSQSQKSDASLKQASKLQKEKQRKELLALRKDKVNYFQQLFPIIKQMREHLDAPVDTMGAHMQADQQQPDEVRNFQLLMAILISVQTKDETTTLVMKRLVDDGLSLDYVIETPSEKLLQLIYEANFNQQKVQYMKSIAEIIRDQYQQKIPDEYDQLIALPGIGPKIASLYFSQAHNRILGIAVDTHVHRICNRLELVDTQNAEETQIQLETFVEKGELWKEINLYMVGLGQTICKPINPKCDECLLNDLCPLGLKNMRDPQYRQKLIDSKKQIKLKLEKTE